MINLNWFLLVFIGLLIGTVSGMIGSGGYSLLILILLFSGLPVKEAFGTSLFIQLLPLEFFGILQYYKENLINWFYVVYISIGLIIGIFSGSYLSTSNLINEKYLKIILGFVLLTGSLRILYDSFSN